jgi:6-phosphogluconate dehydrogenase
MALVAEAQEPGRSGTASAISNVAVDLDATPSIYGQGCAISRAFLSTVTSSVESPSSLPLP